MTMNISVLAQHPEAVLFDWDNTLVDTMDCYVATINHTLESMDMPTWTNSEVRQRIQLSARDGLPILFGERWPEAYQIFSDYYRDNHQAFLKPLPGAIDLLDVLTTMQVPIGIVSNKRGQLLRQEINYLGWQSFFTGVVGAGDATRDKPHPDPAHMALNKMGLQSSKGIWFVGDAPVDWECAEAIGCLPIPIGFGHHEADKYTHGVADCLSLKKLLLKN